jgi:hypothetical protein
MTRIVLQWAIVGSLLVVYADTRSKLEKIYSFFVFSGCVLVVRLLIDIPISSWTSSRIGNNEIGLNANIVGMYLAISSIFAVYLAKVKGNKWYYVLVLLFSPIVLLTGSRKALFLLVVGVLGLLLLLLVERHQQNTKGKLALIAGALVIFTACVLFVPSLYDLVGRRVIEVFRTLFGEGGEDESTRIRLNMIEVGIKLFRQKPLLGQGVGSYAHNNYIELLVGVGIVGTLIYYSMYLVTIVRLVRNRKQIFVLPLIITLLLMLLLEVGSVNYWEPIFQILIALAFSASVVSEKRNIKSEDGIGKESGLSYSRAEKAEKIWNAIRGGPREVACLAFAKLVSTGVLNCLPDKVFLNMWYVVKFGRRIDWKNPKTFNEKLQWLKVYNRRDEYSMMSDKYAVRAYVAEMIGEDKLVPLIGVWESAKDVDMESLPNQFVIKCTHDSASVYVCHDKNEANLELVREKLDQQMKKNLFWWGREWPYKNIKPRIIAEEYLHDQDNPFELSDYKFMCFNGECKCIFTGTDRFSDEGLKITFFDTKWNKLPFERHYASSKKEILPPENLDKMIRFAEKLAEGIPFVRVDFYEANGKIYFGELTFFPGNGMEEFSPEEWDRHLGDWIILPEAKE